MVLNMANDNIAFDVHILARTCQFCIQFTALINSEREAAHESFDNAHSL